MPVDTNRERGPTAADRLEVEQRAAAWAAGTRSLTSVSGRTLIGVAGYRRPPRPQWHTGNLMIGAAKKGERGVLDTLSARHVWMYLVPSLGAPQTWSIELGYTILCSSCHSCSTAQMGPNRSKQSDCRHVARVLERGVTFCGGSGGAPQKIFKFKVANTPNFNDFLQLPKKFRMSKYLLLLTEMPDLLHGAP